MGPLVVRGIYAIRNGADDAGRPSVDEASESEIPVLFNEDNVMLGVWSKITANSCDLHGSDGVWTVLKRSLSKGELSRWRYCNGGIPQRE